MKADSPLDWLTFERSDLEFKGDENGQPAWLCPDGDIVWTQCLWRPPDLAIQLNDFAGLLRTFREQAAAQGMGVVEVETLECDGCATIRMIAKLVQEPATGRGRTFLGRLILPRKGLTLLVQVESAEHGVTGIRESLVIGELLQSGALRVKERKEKLDSDADVIPTLGPDSLDGWVVDPSDTAPPHLARNVSDDPKYDTLVPTHPLSRVRARLAGLARSISVAPEFKALPPFDPRRKSWWKAW